MTAPIAAPAMPGVDNTIADIIAGRGMSFDYGGRTYYVRPPTVLEADQGEYLEKLATSSAYAMPDVKALQAMPVSDDYASMVKGAVAEMRKRLVKADKDERDAIKRRINELQRRNRADELAEDWGRNARDRYLVMACLQDKDGKQVFETEADMTQPGARGLMNAAKPVLWAVMAVANSVPFGWEPEQESPSVSQNGSEPGPSQDGPTR